MKKEEYLDKVYGGWIGKCLGGAAGAPVEGIKSLIDIKHYSEVMRPDIPNDDLDLQILWLEVVQKKGLGVTSEDLAFAWDKQAWYPFNEYGNFLRNNELGIRPPYSGKFNNRMFQHSEGAPIRSEIWGMLFPGNPEKASIYAEKDACLDHYEDGVWIEQFYSAMDSQAFYETDVRSLIESSLKWLPKQSKGYQCAKYVLENREGAQDWISARENMIKHFAHNDFTNAVVNLGIVLISLLYGNNMDESINIGFRCGYDTDSTCATIGGVLGIVYGAAKLPDELKNLIDEDLVIGIDVKREDLSILQFSKDVCALGELEINMASNEIKKDIDIVVDYKSIPSFNDNNECEILITVRNNTTKLIKDNLVFSNLSDEIIVEKNNIQLILQPNTKLTMSNTVMNIGKQPLSKKNLISISFDNISKIFGVAGYNKWVGAGAFSEPLVREHDLSLPPQHGDGMNLPPVESMFNNYADFDKQYINEQNISSNIMSNKNFEIYQTEDTLPLQAALPFEGQGCVYLNQKIYMPEEKTLWFVMGNNDAFKLWVNDELVYQQNQTRLWSPFNNANLINLKKGENNISLKLIRNTDKFDFSFALRKYDGMTFNRNRWYLDYQTC